MCLIILDHDKTSHKVDAFEKPERGFLKKDLNPIRVPLLGDSVRIPAVTLTFGL